MHAAQLEGRAVVVKVFSGPRAQEDREETEVTSRHLMHPNFLRMMGCSPDLSPEPFVIYHGEVEGSADRMLAAVLREELLKCLILGVTMVHGISSGLSYLSSKEYPVGYAEPKDFDLLIDANGNLKLCLKTGPTPPPDTEGDIPREMQDALKLLDGLCRMAFKEANRILYCDEVERTVDTSSYPDSHPSASPGTLLSPQPSTDYSASIGSAGRRELVWKSADKGSNLREVSQQVDNFLFCLRTAQARRLVRRYLSSGMSISHHRCPGYSREEIILGSQAQDTVIISHSTPSQQEICTVCGQIVEDEGWFECSCGKQDDGQQPTKYCHPCNVWRHVHCTVTCPGASEFGVTNSLDRTKPGEFRYCCSFCAKTFTALDNLRDHINSHVGVRPHSCQQCGKAITTLPTFNRHQSRCKGPTVAPGDTPTVSITNNYPRWFRPRAPPSSRASAVVS